MSQPTAATSSEGPRLSPGWTAARWRLRDVAIAVLPLVIWRYGRFAELMPNETAARFVHHGGQVLAVAWMLGFSLWTLRRRGGHLEPMPQGRALAREMFAAVRFTLYGVVLAALTVILLIAVTGQAPDPAHVWLEDARPELNLETGLLLLASVTVVPLAEEFLFRGLVLHALLRSWSLLPAMIGQAILFAAIHPYGLIHSLVALLLGILLAVFYRTRGTLFAPVTMHAMFNAVIAGVVIHHLVTPRPMLGVLTQEHPQGCRIVQVEPGSPAEEAGLRTGDVITQFAGEPVSSPGALIDAIREHEIGQRVELTYLRGDEERTADLRLGSTHDEPPRGGP